jgi:arylsulfate sulfotransferase
MRTVFANGIRSLLLIAASSSAVLAQDTTPPQFVTTPVFHAAPVRACPLTATIDYTTDEPARAEIGFRTADKHWSVIAESGYSTVHSTMVLGMHPATQHEIRLRVSDASGNTAEWPIKFHYTTPHLPSTFPPLQINVDDPAHMEPGLTLLPARYSGSSSLPGGGAFVILLDDEGEVVWYYGTRQQLRDVSRMRSGNFLCLNSFQDAFEIDPLGHIVQRWWAANLGTGGAFPGSTLVPLDTFHHEFSESPLGDAADFIGLSSSHRQYPNYPTSVTNLSQTQPVGDVAGSVIFEIRRDGTVVRQLDLLDVLDPYRLCYNSLSPVFGDLYGVDLADWGHANSVMVDTSDDTWVVSIRHQEAVVKIRRSDNSIVWIHGTPERWTAPWSNYLLQPAAGTFEWHFHQHAAEIDVNGVMTMFDNGNNRVVPPTAPPPTTQWYSRAVAYKIDPVTHVTQQRWEWTGGGVPFLSGSLGSAFELPRTRNVLMTAGNIVAPGNKSFAKIQEVSTTFPSAVRFEVVVNDPALPGANPYNWVVYRTRRITSVYPGF